MFMKYQNQRGGRIVFKDIKVGREAVESKKCLNQRPLFECDLEFLFRHMAYDVVL